MGYWTSDRGGSRWIEEDSNSMQGLLRQYQSPLTYDPRSGYGTPFVNNKSQLLAQIQNLGNSSKLSGRTYDLDQVLLSKDGQPGSDPKLYQQFYDDTYGFLQNHPIMTPGGVSDRGGVGQRVPIKYNAATQEAIRKAQDLLQQGYAKNIFTKHKSTGVMGFANKVAVPAAIAALTLGTGGLAATGISGSGGVGAGAGGGAGTTFAGAGAPQLGAMGGMSSLPAAPGLASGITQAGVTGSYLPGQGAAFGGGTAGSLSNLGIGASTAGTGLGGVYNAGGSGGNSAFGGSSGAGFDGSLAADIPSYTTAQNAAGLAQGGNAAGVGAPAAATGTGGFLANMSGKELLGLGKDIGGIIVGGIEYANSRDAAKAYEDMLNRQIAQSDPFGPERAKYQQMLDEHLRNPTAFLSSPQVQFASQAAARKMASMGYNMSPAQAQAVADASMGEYWKQAELLSGLAGSGIAPNLSASVSGMNSLSAMNANKNASAGNVARSAIEMFFGGAGNNSAEGKSIGERLFGGGGTSLT